MPRSATRSIALILCGTSIAGCTAIRPLPAPAAYIQEHKPPVVWVADTNGEVLRLNGPTVRGDSVVGVLLGADGPSAIALTPEQAVFAKQKSPAKTAELIGVFALVGGLATYGIIAGQSGPEDCASQGANPTGRP